MNDKHQQYREILPQIQALLEGETDTIANLSNTAAALQHHFNWHWVGFYLVRSGQLVLGPFQGPPACTRIAYGRGVCGQAWQQGQTLIVPNVHAHPDHIACSPHSQSEIVVPLRDPNGIWGVLDIDADTLAAFDQTDAQYLETLVQWLHG